MTRLTLDISMSPDGFIAGPNASLEQLLGDDGERLHEWFFGLANWSERHGLSGGTINADSAVIEESITTTGAVLMGRRMFSGGEGPWDDDPNADGWWGDSVAVAGGANLAAIPRRKVTRWRDEPPRASRLHA